MAGTLMDTDYAKKIGTGLLLVALGCLLAGTPLADPADQALYHAIAAFLPASLPVAMPQGTVLLLTTLIAVIPSLTLPRLSPVGGLLATLGLILAVGLLTLILFAALRLWFPPAGALTALAVSYPLWGWYRLQAANKFLDQELQQLIKDCRRRSNFDPPCRLNFDPGSGADRKPVGCG